MLDDALQHWAWLGSSSKSRKRPSWTSRTLTPRRKQTFLASGNTVLYKIHSGVAMQADVASKPEDKDLVALEQKGGLTPENQRPHSYAPGGPPQWELRSHGKTSLRSRVCVP